MSDASTSCNADLYPKPLRRTAMFEEHQRLGGRIVDFEGWELPVQYAGVMDEHLACRASAGIFDVSHMGEFHVEGPQSEEFLNLLVSNDIRKISVGQAQYTVMCNAEGGIVDDLVIYRRASDRFLVVVNASNTEKDFAHVLGIRDQLAPRFSHLEITNVSATYSQIALQGRAAEKILQPLTDTPLGPIKNYWFSEGVVLGDIPALLARTGYTGEDGFEIYVPWAKGPVVWRKLLEAGEPLGLKPCGLGARDTLRLEMKYPLYGHELTDQTCPLETGSGWVVKLDKPDFVGRAPILAAKAAGLRRALVGIRMLDRGIPRQGYPLWSADGASRVGEVTSGSQSPSLKQAIAIASLGVAHSGVGMRVLVEVRGAKIPAEVVPTPFYKRPY